MNKAESKTLFNLKLLAISIILLVILSLLFVSKKNQAQNIVRFPEPATKDIKLLSKKYKLNELNISDENYIKEIKTGNNTYINYWAQWCEPCKQEIPALVEFKNKNPKLNLVFVNIDSPEEAEKAKAYWKKLNLKMKSYYMPNKKIFSFSIALPYHQIFDKNKMLRSHFFGEIIGIEKKINKLLTELN